MWDCISCNVSGNGNTKKLEHIFETHWLHTGNDYNIYVCRICGFETRVNSCFVDHAMVEHMRSDWKCMLCSKLCRYRAQVICHLEWEHGLAWSRAIVKDEQ